MLAVLRSQGACSQADLARKTLLSKGTINNVVKKLLADGLISVQQKNKKEALLSLGVGLDYLASVEVRADNIKVVLFDFSKEQRRSVHFRVKSAASTDSLLPEHLVTSVKSACAESGISPSELACVSIAIQAPIDRRSGSIVTWAGGRFPAWKDLPLATHFELQLGCPVLVDNDANTAALAEWTWGCGKGAEDFFYLLCSEGVGGGMVINGKIYRGGTGVAGEVGHMALEDSGPVCFCGGRGCLHSLVSERAIVTALAGSESAYATLAEVIHAAHSGDAACRRVIFEAGRSLGRAVVNTARVIAPSVIAIGGTLSVAGELLMESLRSSAEVQNLNSISSGTELHLAEIRDPISIGCIAAALAHLGRGITTVPSWMLQDAVDDSVISPNLS